MTTWTPADPLDVEQRRAPGTSRPTHTVEVGDQAPDFTLRDAHGADVTLSSFRGTSTVLLVFYPNAFTGICSLELAQLNRDLEAFRQRGVEVLTVSCGSVFTHRAWEEQEGYQFPLLSDYWPHGAVSEAYGVFFERGGFPLRATFVIDRDGVVRWKVVNGPGEARDHSEYAKVVDELVGETVR